LKEIYKKTVLDNGIRVVTEELNSVRSISIGVWIDVGSRDEARDEMGVSHFIEHMLFKGTKNRTAKEIAASLESVGGGLNAFTGREQTCYYARVLDEHLDIAIDVLSDILKNPLLNPSHFEKERKVIASEIKELEDSPADLIHDLLMRVMWKDDPLGRPIIGSMESVIQMPRGKLITFMRKNYTCSRVVIAASGNLKHSELVRKVKRKFEFSPDSQTSISSLRFPPVEPLRRVEQRKTAQTHISLGIPLFPYQDQRRYSSLVLSNVLGGGMSSRLFQTVREQLGLAYSIYSFIDFFKDTGVFGIYLGTYKKNTVRVIELVLREIGKLKKNSLSTRELTNAKYQLKGNLILGMESTPSRMNRLARNELFLNDYVGTDQTIEYINKIKAKDIISITEEFLVPDKLSTVVLGPVGKDVLRRIDWDIL
jgi:predicted Zn-dependent peptidase